jgi:hypothetical protein
MRNKTIICIQCDEPFIFPVAEQERFERNGFDEPRRCPSCRKKKQKEMAFDDAVVRRDIDDDGPRRSRAKRKASSKRRSYGHDEEW